MVTPSRPPQNNAALLAALQAGGVEFVVIGGVAAVLHGSTRMTIDLDVCAPFDPENIQRLCKALAPHHPVHATRQDLSLLDEPPERLREFRLFLIQTALGRLDVLRDVTPIGDFHAIEQVEMTVSGMRIPVIARGQLITVKRAVGRSKDREVALQLELAQEAERERKGH
jgi:hypothetical protein